MNLKGDCELTERETQRTQTFGNSAVKKSK